MTVTQAEIEALTTTTVDSKLGRITVMFASATHAHAYSDCLSIRKVDHDGHAHCYRWANGQWEIGTEYKQKGREIDDARLHDGSVLRHYETFEVTGHDGYRHPVAEYTRLYEKLNTHRLDTSADATSNARAIIAEALLGAVRTAFARDPDIARRAEFAETMTKLKRIDEDIRALNKHSDRLTAEFERLANDARKLNATGPSGQLDRDSPKGAAHGDPPLS